MKILNIGIDLETLSTLPTASVIEIAAKVFTMEPEETDKEAFRVKINPMSCIIAGYHVEEETCRWWSERSEEAKKSMLDGSPVNIHDAMEEFCGWLKDVKIKYGCDDILLWMEGTDFDGSILRYVLRREFPERGRKAVPWGHRQLRDARTFILEGLRLTHYELPDDPFSLIPMPEKEIVYHDPMGDVDQMIWNIRYVNGLLKRTTINK